MKKINMIRPLALLLALAMLLVAAGCKRGDDASSLPDDSSESSSGASSDADNDNDVDVEIDRTFLIEQIDQGKARNSDTVGWIQIPNTTIDDAVLQRRDPKATHLENNSYYLRIDEDKKASVFGCYFADPDSRMGDREKLSRNTIIYGHSDLKDNPDGKKFSQLFKYTDIEFLKENPRIYFSTEDDDMVWQVFAVFFTHTSFNYIQANPSKVEFNKIIDEAKAKSEFIIDTPVTDEDKILTLSTCSAYYNRSDPDSYRLVIMAKLMPSDVEILNELKVEKNPNPVKS